MCKSSRVCESMFRIHNDNFLHLKYKTKLSMLFPNTQLSMNVFYKCLMLLNFLSFSYCMFSVLCDENWPKRKKNESQNECGVFRFMQWYFNYKFDFNFKNFTSKMMKERKNEWKTNFCLCFKAAFRLNRKENFTRFNKIRSNEKFNFFFSFAA